MNKLLFLLVLLALSGCKDMETKKVSSETFLKEELKTINMSELDEYPTFESCDYLEDKEEKWLCFEQKLASNFYQYLQSKTLVFSQAMQDTVWVKIAVNAEGTPKIDNILIPVSVKQDLPKLDVWLHQSLDSLPKIYPAIKRGIPVKTTFKLPVVIQVN
tara:strand:- start:181033 stop:181509 length:477 start_codon:yes stop_codon:yes gene_type:complete